MMYPKYVIQYPYNKPLSTVGALSVTWPAIALAYHRQVTDSF